MKFWTVIMVVAGIGAGCDKGKEGGETGGPPCSEAAAKYIDLLAKGGGNELYSLKPTPDQVKAATTLIETNCTAGWSADTKKCVLATTSSFETGKCWKESGAALRVSQVIFDFVQGEKAKPAVAASAAPAATAPAAGSAAATAPAATAPAAGSAAATAPAASAPVATVATAPAGGSGAPAAPETAPTALVVGDRVTAKWTNGSWYPGKISAVNADGTYNVNFDDGDKSKNLPLAKVKKRVKSTGGGGGTSTTTKTTPSDSPCPGPGLTRRCNGRCVNIQEDSNNCGGCGTVCSGGKRCDGHMFCRDADGNL